MCAKRIFLPSPLLQWYLRHGLVVTKVYEVFEMCKTRCFTDFVQQVCKARRSGDVHPDQSIIASTFKLIGNSGYGSLLMNKNKHTNTKFIKGDTAAKMSVNKSNFIKLTRMSNEIYEEKSSKLFLNMDMPIQLGWMILGYAKLRLLEFYYDFLDVYVDRKDFMLGECDTDSLYFGMTAESLREVIKPDRLNDFDKLLNGHCNETPINTWLPRTCCPKHVEYDKRTPGLFKVGSYSNILYTTYIYIYIYIYIYRESYI